MQQLLLLHGAIGSSAQLKPLEQKLAKQFDVYNLDLPGHGGKTMPSSFSIPFFAGFVNEYCEKHSLKKISIFGYSMGGYVAMYLAKHHPEKIEKLATLATKFHWTEEIAAKETRMLQPATIREKLPDFATALQKRHLPNDWKEVLSKTEIMLNDLGKDNTLKLPDYQDIQTPCMLMIGDKDKMVTLDETVAVYKTLPSAQLAVLPSTPHPIEAVNVDLLYFMLKRFFE